MANLDNPDFWSDSYNGFVRMCERPSKTLPTQNPILPGKRYLDCAFCDYLVIVTAGDAEADSIGAIRSAFIEGKQIFPNSAIYDRTHVQISVIELNLIEYSCIYD